jgi:hypothetical protein
MVLYNVPLVTCTAYSDRNWAAEIKGVGPVFQDYQSSTLVSAIGEFFGHNAKDLFDYNEDIPTDDDDEEDDDYDSGMVVGPDSFLMDRTKCMQMIAEGCIQCGADIEWEEREECTVVNENRNVLCPDCTKAWLREADQHAKA